MKRHKVDILLLSLASIILLSCKKETGCEANAEINSECFDAVGGNYNLQSLGSGEDQFYRENLTIYFNFAESGGERYAITVRSTEDGSTGANGESVKFKKDSPYIGYQMTFNGNLNAPDPGDLTTTFSEVDRTAGTVSGKLRFESATNGHVYSGTFENVAVEGLE